MLHRPVCLSWPALLLLGACGGTPDPGEEAGFNIVRSSLDRELNPQPTAQALQALSDGNHALTLDLYRATAAAGDNYMVSTLSVRAAFAMMYAGALGATADEMSTVLAFDTDQARLHEAMNALDLALQSRQLPADPSRDLEAVEIRQANAFWGRTGLPWEAGYLDVLALNYGAGIHALDFGSDSESARRTINAWVERQTENRIEDLLPEGSIPDDALSVLTNAIYLKAPWQQRFLEPLTQTGRFNRADGTSSTADYMAQTKELGYAAGAGWSAVELPYRGEALSMVLLIPSAGGFATFDASLTAQQVASAIQSLQPTMVDLTLPKFEFETEFTLSETLARLGMPTAFSDAADFGGMIPGGGLKIDEAYHKTFVAIDETGTEAAAATGVVAVPVSAPIVEATVRVDRPFYFLIRDRDTGVWLFFGRVMDPAQT